jgi:hypothetical protein
MGERRNVVSEGRRLGVMTMRRGFLGYGAAVLVFAAVILWAADAPGAVALTFFALSAALLAAMLATIERRRTVLLVGERPGAPELALIEAFGAAGYGVCRCYGPSNRPCPALRGLACPAWSDRPTAAVILRREGEIGAVPPCGSALLVPSVEVHGEPSRVVVKTLDRALGR